MKTKNLIPYPGGKTVHYAWLSQFFPPKDMVVHFVDAMCGSASVALNADFPLKTINDINHEVINFFRVCRNNPEELLHAIYTTPFSREELLECKTDSSDPIDAARKFYVLACQGYGAAGSQFKWAGWGHQIRPNKKESHFRVHTWKNKVGQLSDAIDALKEIQIESLSVFDLLEKYNSDQVFIYIDPPYVRSSRNKTTLYKHEFLDEDHVRLVESVIHSGAYIMISGYSNPLYDPLVDAGWFTAIDKSKATTTSKISRAEMVWCNYNPSSLKGQTNLF